MLFKPFAFYKQQVVGAPPAADKILDTYTGAVAGYGLRLLRNAYTGDAIQVRRSSDNTTQDIGFDGDGNLDESALTTFVGANNGFVSKWYDQSGNGEDMEQTTAGNQAQIVSSGTIIKQGGKPAIRFDGSNDSYISAQSTNPFSYTSPISVVSAVYKNSTAYKPYETVLASGARGSAANNNTRQVAFGFGNSGFASPAPTIVTDMWRPSGIQYNGTVSTNSRMLIGTYISNWSTHRSTGLSNLTLNNSDLSTKTYGSFNPSNPINTQPLRLGVIDTILATSFFAGDMQEVLVWTTDENSNRTGIQTNINDYYSIY